MIGTFRSAIATLALLAIAQPASAQWTRVGDIPVTNVFSVSVKGDTIAAGTDTAAYISTNAGATWKRSAKVAVGVTSVESVLMRNGRLYAGTMGQGVLVSNDLGDSWLGFSQGLAGGIGNSHLFIKDLIVRGDSLYAATSGAGPWVRNLTVGTWNHFGNAFEPNQASNMNAIAAGGSRLFASAGANGTVFHRDPGQTDWTLSWLDNVGIVPGLAALTAIWTGSGWVVGANAGVFTSELGESPWTFTDPGLGTLFSVSFALRGRDLFACFGNGQGSTIATSRDDGTTWQVLETLPVVFTFNIATASNTLYAARFDGLWRRSIANVSVPPGQERLWFAIAGSHPVADIVRFRFELPEAGRAVIEVFDLAGRRVSAPLDAPLDAGPHEVVWSASNLAPGVYQARLRVGPRVEAIRLIRVR